MHHKYLMVLWDDVLKSEAGEGTSDARGPEKREGARRHSNDVGDAQDVGLIT